jgi:hypothetical protein
VLKAVLHGDSVLFREHPELLDALVRVYFHSSSPKYNRTECWGPLKDAAEVKSLITNCTQFPHVGHLVFQDYPKSLSFNR